MFYFDLRYLIRWNEFLSNLMLSLMIHINVQPHFRLSGRWAIWVTYPEEVTPTTGSSRGRKIVIPFILCLENSENKQTQKYIVYSVINS